MPFASPINALGLGARVLVLVVITACHDSSTVPFMGPAVVLMPPSASIAVGDSVAMRAKDLRSDTVQWIWTSSEPGVAAVSPTGVVRGLAPGRSVITAKTVAKPALSAAASALIEVHAPLSSARHPDLANVR